MRKFLPVKNILQMILDVICLDIRHYKRVYFRIQFYLIKKVRMIANQKFSGRSEDLPFFMPILKQPLNLKFYTLFALRHTVGHTVGHTKRSKKKRFNR